MIFSPPENERSRYACNPTMVRLSGDSYLLAYNVNATYAEVMADRSIYRPCWRPVRISSQSVSPPSF
ncbi:hypothetical protein H4W33_006541 [Kibdelosporangium phytohabitans]|nr:hypothetical protein [Kibdelosporangium phytohabitans]